MHPPVRTAKRILPPAVVLAVLAVAAPARADQQIVAAAVNRYVTPQATIAPGERLSFASEDPLAPHDVTAVTKGADGTPLFASPLIRGGQSAVVAGASALAPGSYAFLCSVHPAQMRGTLTVAGTPDATAPVAAVRLNSRGVRSALRRGALSATVTVDEPAQAVLTATLGGVTLARRTVDLAAGATRTRLTLTAAGRRALRGRRAAAVRLTARVSDAAGNPARASARRTLRR
jgi:plastocyanin